MNILKNSEQADDTQKCAVYDYDNREIYYGVVWMSNTDPDVRAGIIEHELGHFLGRADVGFNQPSVPTIMNNPTNGWPQDCENPNIATKHVTDNDGLSVSICRLNLKLYKAASNQRQITLNYTHQSAPFVPPQGTPNGGYSCTYLYSTTNFYVDGVYDSSMDFVSGVICQ